LPEELAMVDRRGFLQRAAVGAALFGVPQARAAEAFAKEIPLPSDKLLSAEPELYWAELRKQWLLANDRINLNCGSVGCTPLPVLRAVIDHLLAAETFRDPGYPWFGYEEKACIRQLREALATFLNCGRDELALVRNATEANNVVCHGLDLNAGDEVLLTNQEHPGGRCCWEVRAKRHSLKLHFVQLPRPPASTDEILDRFAKALTPKTRVLVFSHITSPTGLLLPAKEICALARKHDVLTLVDGAHTIGQIPLDLHHLGCDFYATSPHKWLLAPKGTGVLYIREEHLERLWVHTASSDWQNYKLKAYRFSNLGTSNLSVMVGLKAALDFYATIGPERIYARIHALAKQVRDHLHELPQLRLANASAEPFYAGLVSFEAVKGDLKPVIEECNRRHIRVAGGPECVRVATHVFTQREELHALFDAVAAGSKQ
jgi:isopenicillin-N epimerase